MQGLFPPDIFTKATERSLEPAGLMKGFLTVFDRLQEINVMVCLAHTSLPFAFSQVLFQVVSGWKSLHLFPMTI